MYVTNKEIKLMSLKPMKKVEGSDKVRSHSAALVNCQTAEISSDGQRGTAPGVNPPSGLHVDFTMEVFQSINCVRIWKRLMAVWERFVKSVRKDHESVSSICKVKKEKVTIWQISFMVEGIQNLTPRDQ